MLKNVLQHKVCILFIFLENQDFSLNNKNKKCNCRKIRKKNFLMKKERYSSIEEL